MIDWQNLTFDFIRRPFHPPPHIVNLGRWSYHRAASLKDFLSNEHFAPYETIYELEFDDEEDFIRYSDDEDNEEEDDDEDESVLTERERVAMADVNGILAAIDLKISDQVHVEGRPIILHELVGYSNLTMATFNTITDLGAHCALIATFLQRHTGLRSLVLRGLGSDLCDKGIPADLAHALTAHQSLGHLKLVIPQLELQRNDGMWLQTILGAVNTPGFTLTLYVCKSAISQAMIAGIVHYCLERTRWLRTIAIYDLNKHGYYALTPLLLIAMNDFTADAARLAVRPVLKEIQISRSLKFSVKHMAHALRGSICDDGATSFCAPRGDSFRRCTMVESINLALRNEGLRVKHVRLVGSGHQILPPPFCSAQFDYSHIDPDPTALQIDNQYVETFENYTESRESERARLCENLLHRTCRWNRSRRKIIDRDVHLVTREAHVLLFATKRPRWLLMEIADAVITQRIIGLGYDGVDARKLLTLCHIQNEARARAAFVATARPHAM